MLFAKDLHGACHCSPKYFCLCRNTASSQGRSITYFLLFGPQVVNGWVYHASRAPNQVKFNEIMEEKVKPTKPLAYEALMRLDLKRWTHHAGPQDTVIADQTTSNPVEQTMSMIGKNVSVIFVFSLARASAGSLQR